MTSLLSSSSSVPAADLFSVIVRAPLMTDAVGAGIAHHHILIQGYMDVDNGNVDTSAFPSEEELVDMWHQKMSHPKGKKIAVALHSRRVIGMALLENSPCNDHGLGAPARPQTISFLATLKEYAHSTVLQRLFDFILPDALPAQAWVLRKDQYKRRFFRMNGFTLDGVSTFDDYHREISRLTR